MLFWFVLAAQAADFAGSAACAVCHPAIAKSQGATHHAAALARTPVGAPVPSEWAFGAGAQAVTYVSQAGEDHYLEHGQSFYAARKGLAATPGHAANGAGVRYRTFAPDAAILRCFQCHSTGRLQVSAARRIEPAEPGVRCEVCHGPAKAHAAAPARDNVRNPGKLSPQGVQQLCGECHRMPPAKGVATNWSNPWNTRHQPVYLAASACFEKGGLTCFTCHNPHDDAPVDAAARCRSCHTAPAHKTAAGGDCVSCHMPKVRPSPELAFTNHWIGIYGANRLRPLAQRARLR